MIVAAVRTLRRLMALPIDNPELLKAQYFAMTRQTPLFYFVLLVSSWTLAATFYSRAPLWLTVGVISVLTLAALARAIGWWRSRHRMPDLAIIIRQLRATYRVGTLLSACFCVWVFALYPYGDHYGQANVVFFMIIMDITCIFCTMHVRATALSCTAILNTAFVGFFVSTGNPVLIMLAANYVLVSAAMLLVMQNHYHNFARLTEIQARDNRLANEDSLTGLPNRRQFFVSLDNALRKARRDGGRLAVGILDLDGFKPVNDVHGHSMGDLLLTQVAHRLGQLRSPHIHIARLGGDEFAFLFNDACDDVALDVLGHTLCAQLRMPFHLAGVTIEIGASLGIATYPDMAGSANQIYEFADYALYHSKRCKTGGHCFFSPALYEQLQREAAAGRSLRKAYREVE